ncbi:MAG: methyltransferase domain-containing protein [Chloroflexota bacterium]
MTSHTDEQYAQALAGEGEYWDTFVAKWLLRGKMPGSIDFRIAFTQNRSEHDWRPFCLGMPGINFRLREIRYILDKAAPRPGVRVLELGCGAGWLSLELARLGAHVTGIDISPTNLALGRYMAETNARNFPYLYQGFAGLPCKLEDFGSVEYVFGDLNKIDLPPNEYDVVVVADSLHHIADMERLVEQVRATLKPDGVFVGIDHAFATLRTTRFNIAVGTRFQQFYKWVTENDPEWLYDHVIDLGKRHDWGVLNVDYSPEPVPGFEHFARQLFEELLEVVRREMPAEMLAQAQVEKPPRQESDPVEESPFEDVSAERLAGLLLESFEAEHFSTIGPFIEPLLRIPEYRSQKERVFQHYLSAMLIELGEYAIATEYADGQWFLFCLKPERPDGVRVQQPYSEAAKEISQVRQLMGEVEKMRSYIQHLEAENIRKDAALKEAEQYQRRLEAEIAELRRPRLPWKKRK